MLRQQYSAEKFSKEKPTQNKSNPFISENPLNYRMAFDIDSIKFGKMQIIATVIIFLTTLLVACIFGMTGIGLNELLTFKFNIVLEKIIENIGTIILFFLVLSLPVAIITVFAKKMEKINLIIVAIISSFLALIISMIIFPTLQSFWIIGIIYIIAVFFAIEEAFTKYKEVKTRIVARTSWSTTGKVVSIISIGLVILILANVAPAHEEYLEKVDEFGIGFVETLMPSIGGDSGITSVLVSAIVDTQIATVDALLNNPAYAKLREKTDPDVMIFVATADGTNEYFKGPEFRNTIEQQINETGTGVMQKISLIGILREQFPAIETVEKTVPLGIIMGLLHALAIAGIFSMLAMFLCKPTAVIYATIAEKSLSILQPPEPQKPQSQQIAKRPLQQTVK